MTSGGVARERLGEESALLEPRLSRNDLHDRCANDVGGLPVMRSRRGIVPRRDAELAIDTDDDVVEAFDRSQTIGG